VARIYDGKAAVPHLIVDLREKFQVRVIDKSNGLFEWKMISFGNFVTPQIVAGNDEIRKFNRQIFRYPQQFPVNRIERFVESLAEKLGKYVVDVQQHLGAEQAGNDRGKHKKVGDAVHDDKVVMKSDVVVKNYKAAFNEKAGHFYQVVKWTALFVEIPFLDAVHAHSFDDLEFWGRFGLQGNGVRPRPRTR
jgi:hypothetical protein